MRHGLLLRYIPMEAGNYFITSLTFVLSYFYANWMFCTIKSMNQRLGEEQAKRAVYEERERLARELHDSIAQTLFFLNVKLKQGKVEEARSAVSDIDHNVRQAIFNLRSLPEESGTLNHRLRKWLNEWSTLTGVEVLANIYVPDDYFAPAEEIQLFGIMQEGFSNIRKHAKAKQANISLTTFPAGWRLWIADDGIGMTLAMEQTRHYGLSMMQERAVQLGADFEVRNNLLAGLEVTISGKDVNKG